MNNMSKFANIIGLVVLIALGAVLLVHPSETIVWTVRLIGAAFILVGAISVLSFALQKDKDMNAKIRLIAGIAALILGIIVLLSPVAVASILPFLMGLTIAIHGALHLAQIIELKRMGAQGLIPMVVLASIVIALGVLIFCNPFKTQAAILRLIGISMIYDGVVGIMMAAKGIGLSAKEKKREKEEADQLIAVPAEEAGHTEEPTEAEAAPNDALTQFSAKMPLREEAGEVPSEDL